MSNVLTRIKNNQITDSTILANTKIVPGSIVGSLFNSNLTMTSDVTITGNLTVQGSSTYLTVASTNTYVNDPLIVLNNAFSGTNNNDIGLLYNRGDQATTALVWREANDEFRFIYTTDPGTGTGSIAQTGYANVRVGNLSVSRHSTLNTVIIENWMYAGNVELSGNLAVNGNALTSNVATFDLLDGTVTTINAFGAATEVNIGATTGVLQLNNPSIQGNGTTQDLFTSNATTLNFATKAETFTIGASNGQGYVSIQNANIWLPNATTLDGAQSTVGVFNLATTVDAFKAATDLELGATSGTLTINNPTVVGTQTTQALYNTTATTVNAFGAATAVNLGATSGTLTLRNPTIVGTETTANLWNTTTTTVNAFGAASSITLGASSGTLTLRNATTAIDGNATVGGTLGVTGDTTITGDLAVNGGDLTTSASTFNLVDANATTVNFAGAATAIDIGSTSGTLTINNPTVVGTQTTQNLFNTTATTLNIGGAATTVSLGASSGTTTVNNNLTATGNINIDATTQSTNTTSGAFVVDGGVGIAKNLNVGGDTIITGNLTVNGDVTTVNTATLDVEDLNITVAKGAADSSAANGAGLTVDGANATLLYTHATTSWNINKDIVGTSTMGVFNTSSTTVNAFGAATSVVAGATTGTFNIRNANLYIPNATTIYSAQGTVALLNENVTTLNAFGAATALNLGASTGTASLRNANIWLPNATTLDGAQASISVFNNATTVDAFKAGTDIEIGAITGTMIINNPVVYGTQSTVSLWNTGTTTVNALGAASTIALGATSGTLTINNPSVVGSQTTQNLWNTTATTVNFAGGATALTIGATTGNATIRNANTVVTGNAVINSIIDSTSATTGALTVAGGAGIAKTLNVGGNVNINGNHILTLGADLVGGTVSAQHSVAFTSNANVTSRVSFKNISTGTEAKTEYIALADVGDDDYAHLRMGIVNSATGPGQVIKNIDSYILSRASSANIGGNITVGTLTNNDINFIVGGQQTTDRVARVTYNTHSFDITSTTAATSTSTGALVVTGGVGIGANVYVANGAVINSSQSSENFVVKGKNASSLIVADSNHGAVIVGGSNASPQLGATLKVNSSDSMMIPVGSTADRPSNTGNVDVAGMIRYSTTINALEFYTGSEWSAAGSSSTFTIIRDQQFNGDGANVAFTLNYATTTNACMVSINGILQLPIVSYSLDVAGTTLTFTEAPADGDIIDVRMLSTTQTVGELASTNGFNSVNPDNTNGVAIYSGVDAPSKTLRVAVEPEGAFAFRNGTKTTYNQTATNISSASAPIIIDTFPVADYSSAKYVVQTKNGANIEVMEALVAGTSTDAHITTYGIVNDGTALGTLSANVVSGNVQLYYTSASLTNSNVKVYTTYIV